MRTEKFDGEISSAYGVTVSPALKFDGEFQAFGADKSVKQYTAADWDAAIEEIRGAGKFPSNEDIVNFVNNLSKANARQKAMQAALDLAGYKKPTLDTDVQLQLRTLYKVFILQDGATDASAKAMAENAIGAKFAA